MRHRRRSECPVALSTTGAARIHTGDTILLSAKRQPDPVPLPYRDRIGYLNPRWAAAPLRASLGGGRNGRRAWPPRAGSANRAPGCDPSGHAAKSGGFAGPLWRVRPIKSAEIVRILRDVVRVLPRRGLGSAWPKPWMDPGRPPRRCDSVVSAAPTRRLVTRAGRRPDWARQGLVSC
jgi:hypothetical protein